MPIDVANLLGPVREIAADAAARILEIYGTRFDILSKDDASPLTAADLASHEAILAGLTRVDSSIPILSEESSDVSYPERSSWRLFWLVDPLDGTKEFIKRNGEFTVNIALIEGNDPILGVVHVPVSGVSYFAARGVGSFRQSPGKAARRISVRRLGDGPVAVVGSRSHAGRNLTDFVTRLGGHVLVPMGSSLKLCLVAEGKADVYPRLGPTSAWDTAAAQCVVEEAGGRVIDLEGNRLRYNTGESLLNPQFLVIGDADRDWLAYLDDD